MASWSLNQTLILTGVALMHFYNFFSIFLDTVLNEHLIPMGFCSRRNGSLPDPQSQGIQFRSFSFLFLPVLISSNILPPFADIYVLSQTLSLLCQSKWWWKEDWSSVHEYLFSKKETLTSILSSREILFRSLSGIGISCGKIPEGATVFWSWTAPAWRSETGTTPEWLLGYKLPKLGQPSSVARPYKWVKRASLLYLVTVQHKTPYLSCEERGRGQKSAWMHCFVLLLLGCGACVSVSTVAMPSGGSRLWGWPEAVLANSFQLEGMNKKQPWLWPKTGTMNEGGSTHTLLPEENREGGSSVVHLFDLFKDPIEVMKA